MLGLGIIAGGYNRVRMYFNTSFGQVSSSLLCIVIGSIVIPSAFSLTQGKDTFVPSVSHALAIVLLFVYVCVLVFTLKTHRLVLSEESIRVPVRGQRLLPGQTLRSMANVGGLMTASVLGQAGARRILDTDADGDLEDLTPQLGPGVTAAVLAVATALVTFHTEFVSSTVSGFLEGAGVSPTFTGIVLLPILGNDLITITAGYKDQMDISTAYTLGKCAQIALFIYPFCVLLGWIIRVELLWDFSLLEVSMLCTSIFLVNMVVGSGRVHWYVSPFCNKARNTLTLALIQV
jgi:Ca2+:H+ antiporter